MKKRLKKKTLKCLGLTLVGCSAIAFGNVSAEMKIDTRGGFRVYDPCCYDYWFKLGGRLEFDEVLMSGSYRDRQNNYISSGNVRRAFLALEGGVGEDFAYNLTLNFGRARTFDTNAVTPTIVGGVPVGLTINNVSRETFHGLSIIEEAWLAYSGLWDCTVVRFGQFTPVTTMDGYSNYGTTNGQMFLESALATTAFSVPSYVTTDSRAMKGFGVILNTQLWDMFTLEATVYQPAHGPFNVYGDPGRSDRLGEAARITFSPVHECGLVYHLGFMARHQALNHTIRGNVPVFNNLFFTTPEVISRNYIGAGHSFGNTVDLTAQVTSGMPTLVNAGPLRAKGYDHYAAEAAGIFGPFTMEGEYHYVKVHRKPIGLTATVGNQILIAPTPATQAGNISFYGWHVQGGYILTGESRGYNFARGILEGIEPCNPYGAWELVGRYSYVSLIKKDVYGGAERNVTLGANWYVNCNVRFAFNYIRANITPTGLLAGFQPPPGTPKRKLDIFALRAQVVF